jgi:hypothetical protein
MEHVMHWDFMSCAHVKLTYLNIVSRTLQRLSDAYAFTPTQDDI